MESLRRSLMVLESVAELQPVGVGELARRLELPKSTVQRILTTLGEAGWLRPVGNDLTKWVLSTRAFTVAQRGASEIGLREAALSSMHRLRDTTNETIHLAVPDDLRYMVLIERIDSGQAVRTFISLGTTTPIHATSTGRAVLANIPHERLDEFLRQPLEGYSEDTIVDADQLRMELARVREKGYAVNVRQYRPGVAAIGAAVLDANNFPIAGICISMPDSRFKQRLIPEWGQLVVAAASEISQAIS